ncbi:MAG: CopG family antitoxin [Rhizobium sp.]|nr:CopG family antitoxin [Rhizobium sp.]MCZ8352704.1 CopG family antitoxin [Rhizobium sp.]
METKKTLPTFNSDEEAEKFVATADLSDYDLSGFTPVTFEFARRKGGGSTEPPSALPGISPTRGESE